MKTFLCGYVDQYHELHEVIGKNIDTGCLKLHLQAERASGLGSVKLEKALQSRHSSLSD
jgi:hypothetical protein